MRDLYWEDEEGVHLGDSPRRILALVNGLPFDQAATWRQERPGWSNSDELMAQIAEGVTHWGSINAHVHGVKKPPPVERTITHPDRPVGESKPKASSRKRLATPADIAREGRR